MAKSSEPAAAAKDQAVTEEIKTEADAPMSTPIEEPEPQTGEVEASAEVDLEKLIPKDSIQGNGTICPLKRVTLRTILTKRLQFKHIGDSPPTQDHPLPSENVPAEA